MHYDYKRLLLLCDRSTNLPPLPASVFRLMEVMDHSGASANQIATITAADPMLCAKIIRAANGQSTANGLAQIGTIQGAVLRLGHHAVRAIAISLNVQAMFAMKSGDSVFDSLCFARHSILVGLLARYVYVRRLKAGDIQDAVSPEEVLAAGVLHDVPVGLLAYVAPEAYESVHAHCRQQQMSVERGFADLYHGSLRELGGRVMETWGMPLSLTLAVQFADSPAYAPSHREALTAVYYANAVVDKLASETGDFSYSAWGYTVQIPAEVQAEVGLERAEIDHLIPKLLEQVEFYLPSRLMSQPVYIKGRRVS